MAAEWIDRLLAKTRELIDRKLTDGGADAFWWDAAGRSLDVLEEAEGDLETIGLDALIDLLRRVGLGDDVDTVVAGLQVADADGVIATVEDGATKLEADTQERAECLARWGDRLKILGQIGSAVLFEVIKRALLI